MFLFSTEVYRKMLRFAGTLSYPRNFKAARTMRPSVTNCKCFQHSFTAVSNICFTPICLNLVASCAGVPLPARPEWMQNRLYTSWNREELYNVMLMKFWDSRYFKTYSLSLGSLDALYAFVRCKHFKRLQLPYFVIQLQPNLRKV